MSTLSGGLVLFALGQVLSCNSQKAPAPTASPAIESLTGPQAPPPSPPPSSAFIPEKLSATQRAMGTHVTFVSHTSEAFDERAFERVVSQAMAEIERLEGMMSSWREDSEISRLNQAQGRPVAVSAETFEVIEKSIWAGEISEGTFDITFQVMSGLWRFGDAARKSPTPPEPAEVARLKPLINYKLLQLDRASRKVSLGPGQRMSLGGVAKGYVVDRVVELLRKAGMKSFLVQAGGDLYGAGRKPDGKPWVSGIQDPRGHKGDFFATLELADHAFSTAGDYARAYEYQGRRYHHIIDPRTGYPASASRSVTIWAKSAFVADAIDDGVFILGPEKGLNLVEALPDTEAVIVDGSNKVWVSAGLEGRLQILHQPTP